MNTDKEFVPYEPSLALKELGFDEPCFGRYNPDNDLIVSHTETYNNDFRKTLFTQAPTFSQAFRWFREKYNLFMLMQVGQHNREYQTFYFNIFKFGINLYKSEMRSKTGIYTYEEAELECLIKLIEIVKNK